MKLVLHGGKWVDPNIIEQGWEKLNEFADWFIGKEMDLVAAPTINFGWDMFATFFKYISTYSVEITVIAICGCALGMMVGPLWESGSTGKWFGRVLTVTLGGAIWRMLL